MQGPFSDPNVNRLSKSQPPNHKELYIAGCLKQDNHFIFLGGKAQLLALKTTIFVQLRVNNISGEKQKGGWRDGGREGGKERTPTSWHFN